MLQRTSVVLLALLLAFTSLAVQAETRYVSDELEITLRRGKSDQHKILGSVESGAEVEVLEVDQEAGFTRVQTPSGTEGWVLTRYLMDEPAARDRIADMRERLERNQERMEEMEGQREELQALEKENGELTRELEELKEVSSNAVDLKERAETLDQKNQEQAEELKRLQEENSRLQDLSAQTWFTRGAGVIIAGMLVGLILPRIRFRKKRRYEL
ncbi:MAG: TIGR04211 family SH3 domain-containing protein [Thiohalorhabdus sp.]|uniref:TIGR04211 family SH3 domain-containing protein n=1 Tax=Thiohalorhabdus sp. TaxID=3094134 RepID=UPI00397FF718